MIQELTTRIEAAASQSLYFDDSVPSAQRIAARKKFLREETAFIKQLHYDGASGLKVAQGLTILMDTLVKSLAEPAFARIRKAKPDTDLAVSIVALGGYGRKELCPLSDVDIMFLYPSEITKQQLESTQNIFVDEVLYPLWDTGLKVGHSTRTVDEVFKEAKSDIQTKTALLEARLIAGSQPLFDGFQTSYHLFYRKENPKEYIKQRLSDQAERRVKYGGSVFMQEPDIKNGVGGLRDYHNTLWMAQVRLNVRDIVGLSELNYIRKEELSAFTEAYDFLLRTRNELHFRSQRPTDLLSLEVQPKIALRLGYKERNIFKRVEVFMRDYYRHAQTIYQISKVVENRLSLKDREPEKKNPLQSVKEFLLARRKERLKRVDGFLIRGREITYESPDVFEQDPERLIRVFRHNQRNNVELGLELSTLISTSTHLINQRVITSSDANLSFRTILQETGNVYPTLSEMHELGVIGAFIPEWDKLTCLVQHEYFHRYTADIHTLETIRELDEIFTNPDPLYKPYRDAIHELPIPGLLYLILFLHDIGKAKAIKNHAESGVEIADPILERLQIDEENRVLVRFIIRNHLNMARFWQKYDIDDPDTAKAFAQQTENPDQLHLLYVHTFCDARGTARGLWNNYKDTLHRTLYRRSLDIFKSESSVDEHNEKRKQMTQAELLKIDIPGVREEEITAHFKLLPDRYFINTASQEIALHIQMINKLMKDISHATSLQALRPVIDWREDLNRSFTVVNVVTWDRAGLFYKLAGALNIAGYSILSAKAVSRDDHIAIDTFYVVESGRIPESPEKAKAVFENAIHDALLSDTDLYPRIQEIMRKEANDIFRVNDNPLAQSFEPRVDVYHELSLQRTILEVQATDHLGLLYQISQAIYKHGFDIIFARINTERGIAIDTLYLTSADPKTETDGKRLMKLRDSLSLALSKEEEKSA